jgi:6-phospho-3-hexuloisomerase
VTLAEEGCQALFVRQLTELGSVLHDVSEDQFRNTTRLIGETTKVFLTGRGRNGLAMKAFANRLMQIGKSAFLIGDILTPPVHRGNVVVIATGSGKTSALLTIADAARDHHAVVIAFTATADSPLAERADQLLVIPTKAASSQQPLGTLFEQALGLVCDALVVNLMTALDVNDTAMLSRHANIE